MGEGSTAEVPSAGGDPGGAPGAAPPPTSAPPGTPPSPGSTQGPPPSYPPGGPGPGSYGPPPSYPPGGGGPGGYGPPPSYPPGGGGPGSYGPPPSYPPGGGGPGGYGPGYGGYGGYGPPVTGTSSGLANYGIRLGGWLIDWVILLVVGLVLNAVFNAARLARINFQSTTTSTGVHVVHVAHFSVLGPIVDIVIVLLYGAFFCGSARGQTIGMMAVGARAVDMDTGSPIGFSRALGRAAFEYLMFLVFVVPWVVDMRFPAWDPRRQTLHAKVTRTVVVRV